MATLTQNKKVVILSITVVLSMLLLSSGAASLVDQVEALSKDKIKDKADQVKKKIKRQIYQW
jgi:hypothetical protein